MSWSLRKKSGTPATAEVINLYDQAASVLDKYGWHQGDLGDPKRGFCVYGAAIKALTDNRYGKHAPEWFSAEMKTAMVSPPIDYALQAFRSNLEEVIKNDGRTAGDDLFEYNDIVARSVEDIQLLLKKGKERAAAK